MALRVCVCVCVSCFLYSSEVRLNQYGATVCAIALAKTDENHSETQGQSRVGTCGETAEQIHNANNRTRDHIPAHPHLSLVEESVINHRWGRVDLMSTRRCPSPPLVSLCTSFYPDANTFTLKMQLLQCLMRRI